MQHMQNNQGIGERYKPRFERYCTQTDAGEFYQAKEQPPTNHVLKVY